MKNKITIYLIISFLIGILIYDYFLKPKNTDIKRQKLDLSIDIGKLLFIKQR